MIELGIVKKGTVVNKLSKRFYPKTVMLYVSEDMKKELSNIPNASEFVRQAIQEKLSTIKGKVVDNNGEI